MQLYFSSHCLTSMTCYKNESNQKCPWICFNFPSFIASQLVVIEYLQCVHNVMQEMCIVKFCTIGQDPQITEL